MPLFHYTYTIFGTHIYSVCTYTTWTHMYIHLHYTQQSVLYTDTLYSAHMYTQDARSSMPLSHCCHGRYLNLCAHCTHFLSLLSLRFSLSLSFSLWSFSSFSLSISHSCHGRCFNCCMICLLFLSLSLSLSVSLLHACVRARARGFPPLPPPTSLSFFLPVLLLFVFIHHPWRVIL